MVFIVFFLSIWVLLMAQKIKNLSAMQETPVRSPGDGNGNPVQYSCLEDSMDGKAWGGYSTWGHKESETTERLTTPFFLE